MNGLSDFSFIDMWGHAHNGKLVGEAFERAASEVVNTIAKQVPEIASLHTRMKINQAVQTAVDLLEKLATKIGENCDDIANIVLDYDGDRNNNDTIDERIELSKKWIGAHIYEGKEIIHRFMPNDYSSDDPRFRVIDLWDKFCGALNSPNIQLKAIDFLLYDDVQDLRDDLDVAVNKGRETAIFKYELGVEQQRLKSEYAKLVELKRHYLKATLEETAPGRPVCQEILEYVTKMPPQRLI